MWSSGLDCPMLEVELKVSLFGTGLSSAIVGVVDVPLKDFLPEHFVRTVPALNMTPAPSEEAPNPVPVTKKHKGQPNAGQEKHGWNQLRFLGLDNVVKTVSAAVGYAPSKQKARLAGASASSSALGEPLLTQEKAYDEEAATGAGVYVPPPVASTTGAGEGGEQGVEPPDLDDELSNDEASVDDLVVRAYADPDPDPAVDHARMVAAS